MASSSTNSAPSWLPQLLNTTPTLTLPNPSTHNKPNHPELQPLIADLRCHPALEAALHLANGDLYSAHFLVRKGQGGARELDWGHALLHRLEGDWGNAKCWYTDLDAHAPSSSTYKRFTSSLPSQLTACQFVDLTALYSTAEASPPTNELVAQADRVWASTESFGKVKSAYSHDELRAFANGEKSPPLSRQEAEKWARKELEAMVNGLAEEHGWGPMSMEESVAALKEQKGGEEGPKVEHDAQGMIAGGGGGRKF